MNNIFYRFFNRPVSPHLTIYKVNLSSMLSILHRFSGLILLSSFILFLICNDLLINFFFYPNILLVINYNILLVIKFIYWLINFNIFYHWLNGSRFILINFGIFINLYIFNISIIIFFIIKILNILCF